MSDQTEGIAGVGMFVAAFLSEDGAVEELERLKDAKRSGTFHYDNVAVIRCNKKARSRKLAI